MIEVVYVDAKKKAFNDKVDEIAKLSSNSFMVKASDTTIRIFYDETQVDTQDIANLTGLAAGLGFTKEGQ